LSHNIQIMATLSLVLDKRRQKRDGTYPLVFQVVMNSIPVKLSTGVSVLDEVFDCSNNSLRNSDTLTKELFKIESLYRSRLQLLYLKNPTCSSGKEIKEFLLNKTPDELTIADFWDNTISDVRSMGRLGGVKIYEQSKRTIGKHTNLDIQFHKFTYRDLLNLEQKLHLSGVSVNGMGVYLRCFRAICNKAIREDLVSFEWYPFRKYTIKKEKTTPRVISKTELSSYFKLNLDESHPNYKYWNIGKLLFMLRGINITDLLLLKHTNIKSKRIIYKRAKTGKIYSIALTTEIEEILSTFSATDTLLGLMVNNQIDGIRRKEHLQQCTKVVNAHLHKIGLVLGFEEKLTTYVFRYSYANIAKQLGFSKDLIAEALGHEYGNSVTGIYLEQFDLEVVDGMNAMIIKSFAT
jgi:integrase/recombinase XerD